MNNDKNANKILKLCSNSDESCFSSSCSSNNFSDLENETKNIKKHNSDKKSKTSGINLTTIHTY